MKALLAAAAAMTVAVLVLVPVANAQLAKNPPGWCNSETRLNRAEQTICDSDVLWTLDIRLGRLYRTSGVSARSERNWIARRDACGADVNCLTRSYEDRISELGG